MPFGSVAGTAVAVTLPWRLAGLGWLGGWRAVAGQPAGEGPDVPGGGRAAVAADELGAPWAQVRACWR